MPGTQLTLKLLSDVFAICRLAGDAPWPEWALGETFVALTRTGDELSVVVAHDRVPPDITHQAAFRALVVDGPLDFSSVGILAAILDPLAEARVSIFAISTYDTDYVLIGENDLDRALSVLRGAGHEVRSGPGSI